MYNRGMAEGKTEMTLYSSFGDFDEAAWNRLASKSAAKGPFLQYGYLKNWWEHRGGGEWPQDAELFLLSFNKDSLAVIAPFFRVNEEGISSLYLLGAVEISDYLDLIGPEEIIGEMALDFLQFLEKDAYKGIEKVILVNVPETSPSLPALEEAAKKSGWEIQSERASSTPSVDLPESWEDYLNLLEEKDAQEIRRKESKLAEDAQSVELVFTEQKSRLGQDFETFLELMAMDRRKEKFLAGSMRDQQRATANWSFETGILQLSFLEINGEKASGYFCFDDGGTVYVYNSGFDPKFSMYSPGWVHLTRLIRHCIEAGRQVFDFMRGDEEYKYQFGGKNSYVMRAELSRNAG